MTSWQDQQMRGGAGGTALDPATGQPMSRRAAREAERRAAEAQAQTQTEKPPHPSGVVDFEAHDFSADFTPDQEINVGDTQDIWAALTHGRQEPAADGQDLSRFRSGVPAPEAPAETGPSAVSGELLDRVRDAVLRRSTEPPAPALPPTVRMPQQEAPEAPVALGAAPSASGSTPQPTRRQLREREAADTREDGLPTALFAPQPAPARPLDGYDAEDDAYYDRPYAPEPTIAIPVRATDLATPPATNPVALPQGFAEPTGDDALTFSSPVAVQPAEPLLNRLETHADAAFLQPGTPWGAERGTYGQYDVEDFDEEDFQDPQPYAPQAVRPAALPADAPMPFVEPRTSAAFQNPQLGPPSEVTDLAGFEALIRKARQQPAEPQAAPVQRPLAWADAEEDPHEGFTGLLSRSVQGSHGSSNALILPTDPQPADLTQAVSGTGDIFVTGTMNLSRSLSTTGAAGDRYDSHEIDHLYEGAVDEPAAGVAPVRASRAVSGATQDRQFAKAKGGRGTMLPTVLAIVAGAMAVGVVGLLVVSWASNIF